MPPHLRPSLPLAAVVAALGVLLSGCPAPNPGADAGCEGQPGCACTGGTTCQTGECIGGSCVDCRRGEADCSCRSNGTCNPGLKCASQLCQTCTAGTDGCPCGTGDTCNSGLVCTGGTCTPSSCTAGAAGCPCRGAAPKCDGTNYCDTASVCQACSADVVGCPCGSGNICTGGLTCDGPTTQCRAPVTCAAQKTAGTCKAHQACTDAPGADGVCTAQTCAAGYRWNATVGDCTACVSSGCTAEPDCGTGDGGLGDTCATQNRACTQSGQVYVCAGCLPGFAPGSPDGGSTCVPAPACGSATCQLTEYCETRTGTPICTVLPCPAGQAMTTLADGGVVSGSCAACGVPCTATGFTGRAWPFRSLGGNCLCETQPGYFLPSGISGSPTLCDADGDGWVNDISQQSTDPAVRANARCEVRKVDTVKLVDEVGGALELTSCAVGGMQPRLADGGAACASTLLLRLIEDNRNDALGAATVLDRAPPYGSDAGLADGGSSRNLLARELNGLTKACVTTIADYNKRGGDDVGEIVAPADYNSPDDQVRLGAFSFFMELYTARFEDAGMGLPGKLVIQERSRCDADFPFHYDPAVNPFSPNDGYSPDAGATYWRNCGRRRDAAYNQATPTLNFDFASLDCAATSGSCPYVVPPHPSESAPLDPATKLLRRFGVCEMGGQPAKDGLWRGMNHHSQFKCVRLSSAAGSSGLDYVTADFGTGGSASMIFNDCVARPCSGPNDTSCATQQGTGLQTWKRIIDCKALAGAPPLGTVGFAAVKYRYTGVQAASYVYSNGCVTEDYETPAVAPINASYQTWLCPYPEYSNLVSLPATQLPKSDAAFGRFSCYPDAPNFLWAPDTGSQRATLGWALGAGDTGNGYLR